MLKNVELLRVERTKDDGTFGNILIDEKWVCMSREPFDCIPEGSYHVVADDAGRWRYFRVLDVIGFTDVEWHLGNKKSDTKGCILTGMTIGKVHGDRWLLQSTKAMDVFMDALEGAEEFSLTIKEVN